MLNWDLNIKAKVKKKKILEENTKENLCNFDFLDKTWNARTAKEMDKLDLTTFNI